ncbi:MAG: SPFH domain-containing protein, partial [Streptosporangiaceae bacterium]
AIEQITATMLRSVIGSMDLEQTLTSRDKINALLRGVLDDASGKWGIRVTRVEIKAIDPPKSVKDAMEKQMRAEREKRAAILTAEGVRQSKILTAEGEKQSAILTAEGARQGTILRAEGQAQAIAAVFQAVHDNDPDPKLLAYQYLQTLPQLAQGAGNTFWVIPSEVTTALRSVASAFGAGEPPAGAEASPGTRRQARSQPSAVPADARPAISASPAAGATPEPGAEPSAEATSPAAAVVGPDPAVAADAMTALLAATVPGVNFGDPLGSADPLSAGDRAQTDVPAVPQDLDTPTANGSEPAN